ncbi:MAG: hypothetical protein AB1324_00600 [Candidatus Micrarchaeota archaeon]
MDRKLGYPAGGTSHAGSPKIREHPLSDRIIPPITEEKMKYLETFLRSNLGQVDALALENALIVLGDGDTIRKRGVGPLTFQDLLADAKNYYAVVHAYYDPDTSVIAWFSGRRPDDEKLVHVKFLVDFEREISGERIIRVDSHSGPVPAPLKALEGMQVSGGFGMVRADSILP